MQLSFFGMVDTFENWMQQWVEMQTFKSQQYLYLFSNRIKSMRWYKSDQL